MKEKFKKKQVKLYSTFDDLAGSVNGTIDKYVESVKSALY